MIITERDLSKIASLPLNNDARFNSFLAMYARTRQNGGCKSCRRTEDKNSTAVLTAGAALKAIAASEPARLKAILQAHFNTKEDITVSLGPFFFRL